MSKRFFLFLILAIIAAGGLFAQVQDADSHLNWISGEVGLFGAGLRYERMMGDKVSIGGTAVWGNTFFFFGSVGAMATGRFYPWGGAFYAELGVGFGNTTLSNVTGVMVAPSIGWKIDVGLPGGFFLNPHIAVPLAIGKSKFDDTFGVGFGFRTLFGMGYAF